ncbi:MAG: gamma-glutamyltranspeptidase / glutathione hydrolase [Gaiellaceae bacterium]|nr:gamma-glutamyltranspeptidase / glutathione hydrolase [Gaiellaceae bacterium]
MLPAAVAAGHPATVAAGIEVLEDGGTAADAAVAAALASCVAETMMTGLLGGAHAIYWDGQEAWNLDCFVDVPSGAGAPPLELQVPFGEELVHYAIGPGTCAAPGLASGLDALWRRYGRLPWPRLVEPALRLARAGVPMPPAHVACLEMLAPVYTMQPRGAAIHAPGGRLLETGDLLAQPGLVTALELVADEGAATVYTGSVAEALLAVEGIAITRGDLERFEARWVRPVEVGYAAARFLTRAGLSGVPESLERLPVLRELGETERVHALLQALTGVAVGGHTTNLVTSDAEGRVCVLTSSLGLGTGDFLPGLDLHLNSMLGEVDLMLEPSRPGERMQSMMAPSLALDGGGVLLGIGAAGGTRLRTALVGVAAGILDEGLAPADAVTRPRFHRAEDVVNTEPGVDEQALAELERQGLQVRRWPGQHHYFGGVSVVGGTGIAGDPRRSGHAASLT